jgi:hypothetical protein
MANLKFQNKNYVYNELDDNGKKIIPDLGYDGLGKVILRSRWNNPSPFYMTSAEYPLYDEENLVWTSSGWNAPAIEFSPGYTNEAVWLDRLSNGKIRLELNGDLNVSDLDFKADRKWIQTYAGEITSEIANEVAQILDNCSWEGVSLTATNCDYIIKFVNCSERSDCSLYSLYFVHLKDWSDHLCFHLIGGMTGYDYITHAELTTPGVWYLDNTITTVWLDDEFRAPMIQFFNDGTITGDADDWVPNAVKYNLYNLEPCSSSDFQTLETFSNNIEGDMVLSDTSIDGTSLNTESGDGIAFVFDIMALGLGTTICAPHAYKFALINSDFVENGFNIYYTQDLNETNKYTVIPPNSQDMGTYGWWNSDSSTVMIFWKYDAVNALGIDDIAQAPILLSNWYAANTNEELNFTGLSSGIYTVTAVDKDGNESGVYNVVANGMEELNI